MTTCGVAAADLSARRRRCGRGLPSPTLKQFVRVRDFALECSAMPTLGAALAMGRRGGGAPQVHDIEHAIDDMLAGVNGTCVVAMDPL